MLCSLRLSDTEDYMFFTRMLSFSLPLFFIFSCTEASLKTEDDDRREDVSQERDTNMPDVSTDTLDSGSIETDADAGTIEPDADTGTIETDADTGTIEIDTDTGTIEPDTDTGSDADTADPSCGDGIQQAGEECDNGSDNADNEPNACRTNCLNAHCGDNMIDTGEDCDDGDSIDDNECSNTCVPVSTRVCMPCDSDSLCGRNVDRCVALPGGSFCAIACQISDDHCPEGYSCQQPESGSTQCLPTSGACSGCYDPDNDGYGIGDECTNVGEDCDQTDPNVHPGATEICNNIDDNCAGGIDEGFDFFTYYRDADDDGYGTPDDFVESCDTPTGYVTNQLDCNDANANVYEGADEICDNLDNDCDGSTNEGFELIRSYLDADSDGHGDLYGSYFEDCEIPDGRVRSNDDCDDSNASVYEGADEVCDNLDNNCDGSVDEDLEMIRSYRDADGDGYGDLYGTFLENCGIPDGRVRSNSDCNDSNANVYEGANEVCDGYDNNCDDSIDENTCPYPVHTRENVAYMFVPSNKNWGEASSYCASYGYHLVTINDASENSYVATLVADSVGEALCSNECNNYNDDGECDDGGPDSDYNLCELGTDCTDCGTRGGEQNFWIGFNDQTSEGNWTWQSTGSGFTSWTSGEPNDSGGEDCAEMWFGSASWNDKDCGESLTFLCEGPS